jgi:hypothetical protein
MSKFCFIVFLLISLASVEVKAQDILSDTVPVDRLAVGVGAGYDFGGYGVNATYYITQSFGVFAGGGYTPAGVGFNAGVKLRAVFNKQATPVMPFVTAMYGYYAAIAPKDLSYLNKMFYGPTIGGGVDFRPKNSKTVYITGTLLFPIRSSDAQQYINDINNFQGAGYKGKLRVLNGSIGVKFILFNQH